MWSGWCWASEGPPSITGHLRPLGSHQTSPPQAPDELVGPAQDHAQGGGTLRGQAASPGGHPDKTGPAIKF